MSWRKNALYDTCSLISVDEIASAAPELVGHFFPAIAIEPSFSKDRLREERAKRLRHQVTMQNLPTVVEIKAILSQVKLSLALSEVDRLIYVTAVHFDLPVVTADKRLARALIAVHRQAENVALILKQLVVHRKLSQKQCSHMLTQLAANREYLLGNLPPNWKSLKEYTFPD